MKRQNKSFIFAAAISLCLCSCGQPNELPPLNDGYATEFVLPDPVALTQEERDYIDAMEKEYEEATTVSGN